MATGYIIPHHSFIPDSVVLGTKFDDSEVEVHLTGKLAAAVRAEGKETGESDIEVVYRHLFDALDDQTLPKQVPPNSLPIRVRVDGKLADWLRDNAAKREISPEDSALEIIAEAFDIPRPTTRPIGKKKSIAKGLTIAVEIPGVMAQALRIRAYPRKLSAEQIVGLLQWLFRDPEDYPPLPGMEDCL